MYFTHSGFPKTSCSAYRSDNGDIWLALSTSLKVVFSDEEARQVIQTLRNVLRDEIDSPPSDEPAAIYREAYFAGMADGPAPGAD